jgi:N-acetylglutamate synthase-like GNAT family acetyltransferase
VTEGGAPEIVVRPAGAADRDWIERFLTDNASLRVARRGELLRPLDHPMLIAGRDGRPVGLLTYIVDDSACEILTLHTAQRWSGVGTALLDAVVNLATSLGCRTLWLITTNDNLDAMRFCQRRGFRIRDLRPGAVDDARRTIKPEIPATGEYGIPIRDEIHLERPIDPR